MIYTVTFNPAIDYTIGMGALVTGSVNRTETEQIFFGGKGINVSYVLNMLGVDNVAMGFVAGFTGKAIQDGITKDGIRCDFVQVQDGFSRINVKIKGQQETEINGQGPKILPRHIDELFQKLDRLQRGDTLVLAGSIPNTLPSDMYQKIFERLANRGIAVAVDATNDLLLRVLRYHPFVVKPNHLELAQIFNVELHSNEDVIFYAKKLQSLGASNVIVSMAERGSIMVDQLGKVHSIHAPRGVVLNSVGAGDSLLAGFLAGYVATADYTYALRLGTACGSATAFSEGLANKSLVDTLFRQVYYVV
jgi:1-phosphofructokinase